MCDRNRLHFGKDRNPRVALLRLAAVPMLLIAARDLLPDALLINFLEVGFRLIEAEDIWIGGAQEFFEFAAVDCGTDTIDIPRTN